MTTPPEFFGSADEPSEPPAGQTGSVPADPAAERTEVIPPMARDSDPGPPTGDNVPPPPPPPPTPGPWPPPPAAPPEQAGWSGQGRGAWSPQQPAAPAGYPTGMGQPMPPPAEPAAQPTGPIAAHEPFFTDQPAGASGPTTELPFLNPSQNLFGAATGGDSPHQALVSGSPHRVRDAEVLASRPRRVMADRGWRRWIAKLSAGLINPGPSAKQEKHEELLTKIRSSLAGVDKVAFLSAKGGVGKTTMTVALGSMIARERGDRVIAVDVNTDLGDLAARFDEHGGAGANIEHLATLRDSGRYARVREHTVQNKARLEALSSQNDPRSSYTLNAHDYAAAMRILETHYNVILLDCGTAITAPLFTAIAEDVTTLVVVASQTIRGVTGARNTLEWLHAHGYGRLLPHTIVVLNATDRGKPLINLKVAETMFRQVVADVVQVPHDPHLAEGAAVEFDALRPRTRQALLGLAGAVADHYPLRHTAPAQAAEPRGF